MKALIGGVLSFLFFNAGMHGRVGSMVAAFIDPGALQELTPTSAPHSPGTSSNTSSDFTCTNGLLSDVSGNAITDAVTCGAAGGSWNGTQCCKYGSGPSFNPKVKCKNGLQNDMSGNAITDAVTCSYAGGTWSGTQCCKA